MARNMSDAEIRARKKYQAANSRATGALGLTALGGTLLATKRGQAGIGRAFAAAKKPVPNPLSAEKIKSATTPILATSAGLGGIGSFNFAAYTGAEGKKRATRQPVRKNEVIMEMGTYGEEGIAKNWSPVARDYSPEGSRARRAKVYENTAYGAAGGLTAASGFHAVEGASQRRRASGATALADVAHAKKKKSSGHVAAAVKHTGKAKLANKKAAGALGAAALAAGAGAGINTWRKKEFGKSAFGVETEVSKLGPPKVHIQGVTYEETDKKGRVYRREPNQLTTKYTGKSLILRRPKYAAVAHNDGWEKPGKDVTSRRIVAATPSLRAKKDLREKVVSAHSTKAKVIELDGKKIKHRVAKSGVSAFGVSHD